MKSGIQRGIDNEAILVLSLSDRARLFNALEQGREVEATIEIKRAPLPPGYAWERDAIVCTSIDAQWCVDSWLTGNAVHRCIRSLGAAATPSFVFDAFRKEGLI